MIKLRKFSLSDLREVMEIEKISFPNQKTWSKDYFKKIYQKYPQEFLVAEIGGKIAGYIIGQKGENKAKIISLAVSPRVRKKGVGTILTKFLLDHFKKGRIKKVSLHTKTKNKIGVLFFKKIGFEISKKIKEYYKNGDDAYLMKKKLGN